jgi:CyaY protein
MPQSTPPMRDESAFVGLTERVLEAIGAALDAAESGDLDWSENDGVLTVDCGAGGRIIVNRHVPNRELWVAAKSGGFHFRAEGGAWKDTRSGEELSAALQRLLQEQGGAAVEFPPLPA